MASGHTPNPRGAAKDAIPGDGALFPLSIGVRLSLSFAAVAALAAAANLIARQSVLVIEPEQSAQATTAAPPSPAIPPHVMPTTPTPTPKPPARVPTFDRRRLAALESAANHFADVARRRGEAPPAAEEQEFSQASQALQRTARDYRDAVSVLGRKTLAADQAHAYAEAGQQWVQLAEQRRAARSEYSQVSLSLSRQVQTSLEGAWKIFGRLLARQSLVQLRASLDTIRQCAEPLIAGEAFGLEQKDRLAAAQSAFAAALNADAAKLSKSEGTEWVRHARAEFDRLVQLHGALLQENQAQLAMGRRLSEQRTALFASLDSDAESLTAAAASAAATPAPAAALSMAAASAAPVAPDTASSATAAAFSIAASPGPSATAKPNPSLTANPPVIAPRSWEPLALITALVMALVATISFFTVRSVVKPVRRLLDATADLANGRKHVHAGRGGIRELDSLAKAFNDMAERLAAAKETSRVQQLGLEQMVLERTHKLQKLAEQDPLTSLPNRRRLLALLNRVIERADAAGQLVGVYFIDVDNFKNVNDSMGHLFGDRVLMSVANRLEEATDGYGFVARLGGDEFTIVFENAPDTAAIHELGERLLAALYPLVSVDDQDLSVSVSVGASIFPHHERTAEGLLRAADSALFRAKELGRSRLAVFTPELTQSAAARFSIEQGLRRALEFGEFELVYQPEIDLETLEVALVEALLRWRMPDGRMAYPGEFLAVAEQSGLIGAISGWVLRTAVEAASHWYHGDWPRARVAVNISSRDLLDQDFPKKLLALLAEFDLPPQAIELELTESVLQTGTHTVAALEELRGKGFGIALDDFGTGYSSLASLEQLPLSRIKLDRSLIARIDSSARCTAIARAIIDLCADLGLQVTAEGIERPAQLAWLASSRSIFLQGFLLAEPMSFEQILPCQRTLRARMEHLLLTLPAVGREPLIPAAPSHEILTEERARA